MQTKGENLLQLPSALGAPEMHQTCQELIRKQGNKPEREYQELLPVTPVWMQHRQNATWELAVVVNQCASKSYWIMQENSAQQPKVYRHTRTFLKVRSTPTDGEQKAQMKEWTQMFLKGTEPPQSKILKTDLVGPPCTTTANIRFSKHPNFF